MENNCPDRVSAFDAIFTTNHIQILKLLVGCMEPSVQGKMAVYIKFRELQYTLQLVKEHPHICFTPQTTCSKKGFGPFSSDISAVLDEMLPFCSPAEKSQLQNMKNTFHTVANMQEMMEMMELLKEMSPELFENGMNFAGNPNPSEGPADLTQMMDMIQMMQGMFGTAGSPTQEQ